MPAKLRRQAKSSAWYSAGLKHSCKWVPLHALLRFGRLLIRAPRKSLSFFTWLLCAGHQTVRPPRSVKRCVKFARNGKQREASLTSVTCSMATRLLDLRGGQPQRRLHPFYPFDGGALCPTKLSD